MPEPMLSSFAVYALAGGDFCDSIAYAADFGRLDPDAVFAHPKERVAGISGTRNVATTDFVSPRWLAPS